MAALIKGTLAGAVILFVWGMISWTVMPWHGATLEAIGDEDAVIGAIVDGAPKSGIYLMPGTPDRPEGMGAAEYKAIEDAAAAKMMKGPVIFASVVLEPPQMGRAFAVQFLIQALGAFLVSALLLMARLPKYSQRLAFVVGVALIVGVQGHLPAWNWWGFSTSYTLVQVADLLIGWGLAGLAMARLVK